MYFKKLPKTTYTFVYNDTDGVKKNITVPVVDIFRKVSFTKESKEDQDNYELFTINKGERPEDIAAQFYGDPNLWWLILLFNDVTDPFNEWVFDARNLNNRLDEFYSGSSYFFMEQVNAKPGDVLMKRDSDLDPSVDISNFGYISNYDALAHRIDVRGDESDGSFVEGDEVYIFRKRSDGGYSTVGEWGSTGCYPSYAGSTYCNEILGPTSGTDATPYPAPVCATAGSTFGVIRKKTTMLGAYGEFRDSVGNIVDPYSGLTGIDSGVNEPSGSFYRTGNICGVTSSVLYRYITNDLPSTVQVKTKENVFIEDNDKRRTVKVLKVTVISRLMDEISQLLSGANVPRGTVRLVDYN